MSIRDLKRQAERIFGPTASVTNDGRLRIEQQEFPLPPTHTASGLALLYARQHGPEALLEPVSVCRDPDGWAYISVPFHELWDFHGGDREFVCARMSCEVIPEGSDFGHSCAHGPAPHDILVCITQVTNPKGLYQRLRAFADDREPLRDELYHTHW